MGQGNITNRKKPTYWYSTWAPIGLTQVHFVFSTFLLFKSCKLTQVHTVLVLVQVSSDYVHNPTQYQNAALVYHVTEIVSMVVQCVPERHNP